MKKGSYGRGERIKGCKERGEWAELCFMARAAGEGLRVSKPYGDSASYDVGVEGAGGILRVQVKSTIYRRRNGEYSLNVMGPRRQRYAEGVVEFFAIYLIPVGSWYIIPYEVVGRKNLSLHFTPSSRRHKYAGYREAWHLLRGEKMTGVVDRIFACVALPGEEMFGGRSSCSEGDGARLGAAGWRKGTRASVTSRAGWFPPMARLVRATRAEIAAVLQNGKPCRVGTRKGPIRCGSHLNPYRTHTNLPQCHPPTRLAKAAAWR